MRTTITLDRDIAAAVEQLRREEGIGPSEALNRLARAGLSVVRTLEQLQASLEHERV